MQSLLSVTLAGDGAATPISLGVWAMDTASGGSAREAGAKCLICGRLTTGGIDLHGGRICPRCERVLCTTDPSNPRYRHYVRVLSALWQGLDLSTAEKSDGINSEE